MTPGGMLMTLYSFCAQSGCTDGIGPGQLVQGPDGNFYGTAGGLNGHSIFFKITLSGMPTTLYTFGPSGEGGPVVQASDGTFYGAYFGQPGLAGNLFNLTNSVNGWVYTDLYDFTGGIDGSFPGPLVQTTDGNFYGTTAMGGASYGCGDLGCGTVFRVTPQGVLTTLYSFCIQLGCTDGAFPRGGLVQGSDGNLYGTTSAGGATWGTIFKITPGGALTTLHIFNGTDGSEPEGALIQGIDGNFYGTTAHGGNGNCSFGCGTVFKITPGGTLTTLHSFDGTDGLAPLAALLQGTDGNFYGMTSEGGANRVGTVFSLSLGIAPFLETQPTSGNVGAPVIILGTNLTGSTSVTFNGTSATFNVVSPSEITTNVPTGATTGTVQVMTPGGTLTSNANFQVVAPLQFVPVTPCRLVDTRPDRGGSGPIQGGTFRAFNLPQLAQTQGCADLSSAAAYSLNIAVVPQGSLGYITTWPNGGVRPYVATQNSLDGRIKANAAIVPAGNNAVSVYATNTTDVIIDIDGYFAPVSSSTLAFYPMTPCRIADTRKSTFPQGLGTPFLSAQTERNFPVLSSTCNIPSTAQAYSLNLSAVPYPSLGNPLGYLEVWPTGQKPANPVSTLNNLTGTVVANATIVPAGTDGNITVYPSNDTDLVIDVNGYFAPAGPGGLSLYPAAPCRVIDTRQIGGGQPFSGLLSPPVDVVDSACAPAATAQAYVFNATVVPFGALGYLTLWQNDPTHQPVVSTLNALDGAITNNMAIVPTADGKIDAYASGITQLILDISSYFAP